MGSLHVSIEGALSEAWEHLCFVGLDEMSLALVNMDCWTTLVGILELSGVSSSAILAKIESNLIFLQGRALATAYKLQLRKAWSSSWYFTQNWVSAVCLLRPTALYLVRVSFFYLPPNNLYHPIDYC